MKPFQNTLMFVTVAGILATSPPARGAELADGVCYYGNKAYSIGSRVQMWSGWTANGSLCMGTAICEQRTGDLIHRVETPVPPNNQLITTERRYVKIAHWSDDLGNKHCFPTLQDAEANKGLHVPQ